MSSSASSEDAARKSESERCDWSVDRAFSREFLDIYHFTIERLLRADNATWIENAFLEWHYPTRRAAADALRHLAVRHLLREVGDAEGTAVVLETLKDRFGLQEDRESEFFRHLTRYVATELSTLTEWSLPQATLRAWRTLGSARRRERAVLSLVIWGDDFIDRAARYCVGSLRSPGNLRALSATGEVTLLVHTAPKDKERIMSLPELRDLPVRLLVRTIPDPILAAMTGEQKYWLLGGLQSLHLAFAARETADFYMLFPDAVFSEAYLRSLADLKTRGADAVLLSGFKASETSMLLDLRRFRAEDGSISIPADRLIECALQDVHPAIRSFFVEPNADHWPRWRTMLFRCRDYLEVHSPHYNIAVLGARALRDFKPRFFFTLDSEIDKILLADAKIHLRTRDDDFFATEVTGEEIGAVPKIAPSDFPAFFLEHANSAHLEIFRLPYRINVLTKDLPGVPLAEPTQIRHVIDRVISDVSIAISSQRRAFSRLSLVLDVLDRFDKSAYGRRNPGLARRFAASISGEPHSL